jgi:HSP20 family protein
MAITRWDPLQDLSSLHNRMNRLFQDFYGELGRGPEQSLTASAFAPPVDVYEDEHKVTLKLEAPGVREEDLDVRLENNMLTISGERKLENEEREENFQRIERRYGSFTRSFTLPNTVDPNTCNANYENGVLKLEFSKRPEAKAKQIKIGSGKVLPGAKEKAA